MESIYLLIPLSFVLLIVAVWAIRYAVKSGQFDDLDREAERLIFDDKQERRESLNAEPPESLEAAKQQGQEHE
jgi:cbb3-type cytochrome oxidase maturation protein